MSNYGLVSTILRRFECPHEVINDVLRMLKADS